MELKLNTGYAAILNLAMPISLAMLVPQINFITNNIFLGGLGQQELAVAGITGVYYLIFAVIGNGLNSGLQALISRRAGQDLPHEIGKLFYHGMWISLAIAAAGIVITQFLAPGILRATLHDAAISDQAISFLRIRIWGLPFLYLYIMRNALLVGTNQSKYLVWGTLAEAVTNIVLDYGLIYGKLGMPELGFNGAAYASMIAEATGLVVIYAVIRFKGFHKRFAFFGDIRWDWPMARHILIKSSPLIAQFSISIATWEYFYILIEHHGERSLAISNTMRNIFGLFGIFSWAFASATNTMVSNIIGQGRENEVMALVMRIARCSFAISLLLFLLLNFWPEWFLSFYGQGEGFIRDAIPVVRVVSIALLMMSFGPIWLNAVTGTGNTKVNLWIEIITLLVYVIYVYLVLEVYRMPITWGWASEWVYWLSCSPWLIFICAVAGGRTRACNLHGSRRKKRMARRSTVFLENLNLRFTGSPSPRSNMKKISIRWYCMILLTAVWASCKDADDNELKGIIPINIEEILVQDTAKVGEEIEILVYAVAPNGCFEDLKITLRQGGTNYYVCRATGYYDSNDTCPAKIVSLDTAINFTPPSAGTFYFQANEPPFPILMDTLTVL